MKKVVVLFFVLTIALEAVSANAATLLVPTNFATIQLAVNASAPGDVIQVSPAADTNFAGFNVLGKSDLIIRANGPFVSTITSQILIQNSRRITIVGFRVEYDVANATGAIQVENSGAIRIADNYLLQRAVGVDVGIYFKNVTDSSVIEYNVFAYFSAAIVLEQTGGSTITHNEIDDCNAGVYEQNTSYSNTFTYNDIADIGFGFQLFGRNSIVAYNIIHSAMIGGIVMYGLYTNIYGNMVDGAEDGIVVLSAPAVSHSFASYIHYNTVAGVNGNGILVDTNGVQVLNNFVVHSYDGIQTEGQNYIYQNYVADFLGDGIHSVDNGLFAYIYNNNVKFFDDSDSGSGDCIYVEQTAITTPTQVYYNIATHCDDGIDTEDFAYAVGNVAYINWDDGFDNLNNTLAQIIYRNVAANNGDDGVYTENTGGTGSPLIQSNVIFNNGGDGIEAFEPTQIYYNTVYYNAYNGIYPVLNSVVVGNVVVYNRINGINAVDSVGSVISANTSFYNGDGNQYNAPVDSSFDMLDDNPIDDTWFGNSFGTKFPAGIL